MKEFTFSEVCRRWLLLKDELHQLIKNAELVPGVIYLLPDIPDQHIEHKSNGEVVRHNPRREIGIPDSLHDITYLHVPVAVSPEPTGYKFCDASLFPNQSQARCSIGTKAYRRISNLPQQIPCTGLDAEAEFVFPLKVLEDAEEILGIKPRNIENVRETDLKLFISTSIRAFIEVHSSHPLTAEELIRFSTTNEIRGYLKIEDSGGKYDSRKVHFDGISVTWKGYKLSFLEVLIDRQFDGR